MTRNSSKASSDTPRLLQAWCHSVTLGATHLSAPLNTHYTFYHLPRPLLAHYHAYNNPQQLLVLTMLRIQVSVQILIPLIFYSAQFILLIFHSCMHLQSASVCCVCCDYCDCIVSQECDSVTSALFQRLRYEFVCSSLFWTVSYFSFRQFVSRSVVLSIISTLSADYNQARGNSGI